MIDFDAIAESTRDSIREAGRLLSFTRRAPNAPYDPAAGEFTAPLPADLVWSAYCSVLPANLSRWRNLDSSFNPETSALKLVNARFVLADAISEQTPQPGDLITFDDATWLVVAVVTISPAGQPVLHKIGVTSI